MVATANMKNTHINMNANVFNNLFPIINHYILYKGLSWRPGDLCNVSVISYAPCILVIIHRLV